MDNAPGPVVSFLKPAPPQREPREQPAQRQAYNGHAAPGGLEAYVQKVLQTVAEATEGTRNDALNRAGYTLGRIIAAGQLDYMTIADRLHDAGVTAGLDAREIGATIRSGLSSGEREPRALQERPAPVTHTANGTRPQQPYEAAPSASGDEATEDNDEDAGPTIGNAVREALPTIDWYQLWADNSEEEWIVEPILPARRLIALYSPPKVGKSLLMLEVAVAVAKGVEVLGTTPDRSRRVLYVDFENDPRGDIRERLQSMGYGPDDLGDLCYLSFPNLAALDTELGSQELMAAVAEYECEVVMIDTISRAVDGEENDNDTWLNFYKRTGLKMKQSGIAMIRLDHTGKDAAKGQRGGSAKSGDVDAVWSLTRLSETSFQLECTDSRMPVSEKTLVLHREVLPHLHHRVDAEGRSAAGKIKTDAVNAALDAAGLSNDVTHRDARAALKTTGIKVGDGRLYGLGAILKTRKERR